MSISLSVILLAFSARVFLLMLATLLFSPAGYGSHAFKYGAPKHAAAVGHHVSVVDTRARKRFSRTF